MNRLHSILLLAALILPPTGANVPAADWPQFLGPERNGTSPESGLLDRFPTNGVPVAWKQKIGTGYSAPSVRGNLLVIHHRIGNEEIIEALATDSGKSVWRYPYPTRFQDPYGYNNGPRCSPLLTEDRCYTFGAEGKLICVELQTGKLVWQRDTAKDWTIPEAFFGVGSSPIIDSGVLIVMVGGQPNAGVVGLDPLTGKMLWESVGAKNWTGQPMVGWPGERNVAWEEWEKQASYSTPVAATIHGQRHVLCLMRQGLVSLDPKTGVINFSFWFRSRANDSVNAMNPVVIDDLILISGAYYKVGSVLLKVAPDGKGVSEVWRSTALEQHWNTPVLLDGNLYAFSGRNEPDARFRCVAMKTGQLLWDRDESWPPHSSATPAVFGRGSGILVDGKLIVLGEGGLLGLFKPNPKQLDEVSRWQVPNLEYPCWASPVLSNKRLYLRSGAHNECWLVCLNLAK